MKIRTFLHLGSTMHELMHLESLDIEQAINEHAILNLTALLNYASEINFAINNNARDIIEVVVEKDGQNATIFKGIVKKTEIKKMENTYILHLIGVSASFLTDLEIKSKSFQNKTMTYSEVMKTVLRQDGGRLGGLVGNDTAIRRFIMQYKETNWEFLKRMASHFNAGLVPSIMSHTPDITVGIPEGTPRGTIEKYNFYVTKDIERYMRSTCNEHEGLTELDTVSFHIETSEDFDIGDTLTYRYKDEWSQVAALYIKSKRTEMIDGTLRFKYSLSAAGGLSTDKLYNEKIVGLSLRGRVLERGNDTVKVFLTEIDDGQDPATAWNFPYSTPYTAEGSSGWYVMPELDDTVYIYFPNREEHHGLGLNAIRLKNTGTDKIGNPEIKYLRTKDGKELKLATDEVVITCANWVNEETGEHNKIYIQFNEKSGITMHSTKPVYISSDGDINFTADKKILFAAEDEIKMKCQTSQIKMDSSIEIISPVVKVN